MGLDLVSYQTMSVFLGGSCNPTMWRRKVAMPLLESAGVAYYNPQVDEWSEDLLIKEQQAKQEAAVLLFVIDRDTRALMSMLEATEFVVAGRQVVLAVNNVEEGQHIGEDPVGAAELKDLNRARRFVADIAQRYNVPVHATVEEAVHACVAMIRQQENDRLAAQRLKLRRTTSLPVRRASLEAVRLHGAAMPSRSSIGSA